MLKYKPLNYGFVAVYTRKSKMHQWIFSGIFTSVKMAQLEGL